MAKKKIEKPKRVATRRQFSHLQRQKRRQRITRAFGISVILAVIGLISSGLYFQWYLPEYKPLKETVIEVNGVKFNMQYYIDALKDQLGEYYYYAQYYLDQMVTSIQQSELIRQKALVLGISVSKDGINEAFSSSGLPDNQAARDMVRTQLLITKLEEEYFKPQLPTSAEQRQVMAMFLESEAQANDVSARLEAGEDFGEIAGELSLESLTKEKKGDLGWRPEGVLNGLLDTTVLEDYIFTSEAGVLSQPVYDENKTRSLGYWLVKVTERDEDNGAVNVQAILVSSKAEAQQVLARLEAGEDFAELAEELSQFGVAGSKADMGWLAEEDTTKPFKDYIFNPETELDVVSGPIADDTAITSGGYWLFKVLDIGVKDISEEDMNLLISDALNEWLSSLQDDPDNNVVSYLNDDMRAFAVKKVTGG